MLRRELQEGESKSLVLWKLLLQSLPLRTPCWGRPPKSLAEGTSYLRIVFASADYCLTCSVALSCFRGSASGPALLVFRRVSFAFRAMYTHLAHTHVCSRDMRVGFLRLYIHDVLPILIREIIIDFGEGPRIGIEPEQRVRIWQGFNCVMFQKCRPPIVY